MKRILVFGTTGQVAWELKRALLLLGETCFIGQDQADFTNVNSLITVIQDFKPTVIVNAVAYTQVDKAESEQALCRQVNAEAVKVIANEAKKLDALLIHYSTDYVYDGTGNEARDEHSDVSPCNYYGESKLAGDLAIARSGCRYIILRTSWVYAAKGHNFIKMMMKLMAEREELRVIADQVGSPTGAELIADTTAHIIQQAHHKSLQEIYHLVSAGYTSWFEYTEYIASILRKMGMLLQVKKIIPITTSEYPTLAVRPLNSRLTVTKIEKDFGLTMPHWQLGVERVINEIVKDK